MVVSHAADRCELRGRQVSAVKVFPTRCVRIERPPGNCGCCHIQRPWTDALRIAPVSARCRGVFTRRFTDVGGISVAGSEASRQAKPQGGHSCPCQTERRLKCSGASRASFWKCRGCDSPSRRHASSGGWTRHCVTHFSALWSTRSFCSERVMARSCALSLPCLSRQRSDRARKPRWPDAQLLPHF